jgi:hypothetical protein
MGRAAAIASAADTETDKARKSRQLDCTKEYLLKPCTLPAMKFAQQTSDDRIKMTQISINSRLADRWMDRRRRLLRQKPARL